mmetsp:Transcript_82330/g.172439  ORF Transcript_82330/g.172439 Transcript_82330/m.172439 type:complete len:250 (-) Transcript_82330:766-1515(-)
MQFMISSFAPSKPPTSAHWTLEARVTATFEPPCNLFTAFSSTSMASWSTSPFVTLLSFPWQARSQQTERRSEYDKPAVNFETASASGPPSSLSSSSPGNINLCGAAAVERIGRLSDDRSLAATSLRAAWSGRATESSIWKAFRRGPPRSSTSSQVPAKAKKGRSKPSLGLEFCDFERWLLVWRRLNVPPRACSNLLWRSSWAEGEAAGPVVARAFSLLNTRTAGEPLIALAIAASKTSSAALGLPEVRW